MQNVKCHVQMFRVFCHFASSIQCHFAWVGPVSHMFVVYARCYYMLSDFVYTLWKSKVQLVYNMCDMTSSPHVFGWLNECFTQDVYLQVVYMHFVYAMSLCMLCSMYTMYTHTLCRMYMQAWHVVYMHSVSLCMLCSMLAHMYTTHSVSLMYHLSCITFFGMQDGSWVMCHNTCTTCKVTCTL